MPSDAKCRIYKTLVESSVDMLVLATPEHKRLYVSPSCADVLGYEAKALVGRTPDSIIHPDDRARVLGLMNTLGPAKPTADVEWRGLRPDGSYHWLETTYRALPDGRIVAVIRDIQRRKDVEAQLEAAMKRLEMLAMYDPLTGIANRRCFLEAVERALSSAEATAARATLLLVDLDAFKPINDLRGHAVGDAVLVAIAERLGGLEAELARAAEDTSWLVVRLGGDEFAVLMASADPAQAERAAVGIVRAVMEPIKTDGGVVGLSASVGLTHALPGVDDSKSMLLRADLALYEAKRQGGAGYCTFGVENARPVPAWGWLGTSPERGVAVTRRRGKVM
jgi:diguanylate cyclase (GGDEF)-like protein/PAS domain S-box-containing protein